MSHLWYFHAIPSEAYARFGATSGEEADEFVESFLEIFDVSFDPEDSIDDVEDEEELLYWHAAKALKTCLAQGLGFGKLRSKSLKEGLELFLTTVNELEFLDPVPLAEETQFDPIDLGALLPGCEALTGGDRSPMSSRRKQFQAACLDQAKKQGWVYVAALVGDGKRIDEEVYGGQTLIVPPAQVRDMIEELERFLEEHADRAPETASLLREELLPALREIADDGNALYGYVG